MESSNIDQMLVQRRWRGHYTLYLVGVPRPWIILETDKRDHWRGYRIQTNLRPSTIPSTPLLDPCQKHYRKSLAMHMVNATKMCIPTLWRSQTAPMLTWLVPEQNYGIGRGQTHFQWRMTNTVKTVPVGFITKIASLTTLPWLWDPPELIVKPYLSSQYARM